MEMPARQPEATLRRTLSFWQVTVSGIGIVIGAGIYVLIGPATQEAGAAVWMAFAFGALLAALTGLSYAELAGMFPSAGAEYSFARHAFNHLVGFMTGWLMIAANIIAAAAVSIGFAHYVQNFVDVDLRLASVLLILVLTAIIAGGIRRSIWLSAGLVVLQIGGLVLVIASGAPHFGDQSLTEGASVSGIWGAAALIFFAFIGFDEVVTLSEETRDAARTIPRALLLALGVSTLLYVLVAIAAVSVIGAENVAGSDTPLTSVIAHNWGDRAGDIVAVIALASTTNTTLLVLTAASRLLFAMSRDRSLPAVFSNLTVGDRAPWLAAMVAGAIAIGFVFLGDISRVASATDLAVYAIFIVVNGALITLRLRMPEAPRTFRTPLTAGGVPLLPIAGIVVAVLMAVQLESTAWLIGASALLAGLIAWAAMRLRAGLG
jgi:APA family basic amino acid/polyamine antiporter